MTTPYHGAAHGTLAFFPLALMQAGQGGAPSEIHLVPAGTFYGCDGRGPYHLKSPRDVIRESRVLAGKRKIAIDYDHQIDFARKNGAPAPAAGWITGLAARQDGIWGRVEWTDRGAEHIRKREYRYLSPVFRHTPDGVVTAVLRAALTNNPNLDQLTALASSEETMADPAAESHRLFENLLAFLRRLLGLAETASDVDVIAAVEKLATAPQAAVPDPAQFVPIGDFEHAVSELNRLNQGVALQAAQAHVELQIRNGNMAPFLRQWGVSLCTVNKPAYDAFVTKTKGIFNEIVDPAPGPWTRGEKPARGAAKLTEDELAMCSRMGITGEELMASRAFIDAQNNLKD